MSDYNSDTQEDTGPKYRNPEWLREKYHGENLSAYEMADKCSVEPQTVWRWLKRHDIDTRSLSESHTTDAKSEKFRDESWLREKYVEEQQTQYEIADLCGVDQNTISNWLGKHGIDARDRSKAQNPDARIDLLRDEEWLREQYRGESRTVHEIGDRCNVSGGTVAKWLGRHGIEVRTGVEKQARHADSLKFTDSEWLREQYTNQDRPAADIADECGVGSKTILKHLHKFGIDVQSPIQFGKDHPNWSGGYPYQLEGWSDARCKAFEEYGERCQACGMSREEHRAEHGKDMPVHHIRKVASFEDVQDAHDVDNLVPLCHECHHKWEGVPVRPTLI